MRHEVVLWGATGFTGQLVAAALAERAPGAFALAGRDEGKLQALSESLCAAMPKLAPPPLILADATDPPSLRALARQARVVCSTVGPYARYGEPLIEACVTEGSHYCDLTGEFQFMDRMIRRWHEPAAAARLRIVHACGFDSVPSDLGCLLAQETALATWGRPLPQVRTYVRELRGGISGGTLASILEVMDQLRDTTLRRALSDPYALLPDQAPRGPEVRDLRGIHFDTREGVWTGPFFMASTNGKVVRRTNALLDFRFGTDQAYDEVVDFGPGARGALRATRTSALLGLGVAALQLRPLRERLIGRWLPAPGEGPSEAQREAGSFHFEVVARDPERSEQARITIRGDRDPGYAGTAQMLAEAALCLARDPLPDRYGILTPASAMGQALIDRLPRAGIRFRTQTDAG